MSESTNKFKSTAKSAATLTVKGLGVGLGALFTALVEVNSPVYYLNRVAEVHNDPTMSDHYKWSRICDLVHEYDRRNEETGN